MCMLNFLKLCSKNKNEDALSICSEETIDLKMLQFDWNKIFPKYRFCAGTQQIIKIFITEPI